MSRFSDKVMPTQKTALVSVSEARSLFHDLESLPALVLAVSGGPDSTALMVLAARWREALEAPPKLIAVTVDHGLRPESKAEAAAVARLARQLKIAHRTLRWTGRKPKTGLPQAARAARYRLLAEAARKAGARHVLTAHTLDDQAETVLIRLSRGSGLTGLAAMQRISVIPGRPEGPGPESTLRSAGVMDSGLAASWRPGMTQRDDALYLLRPLLEIPKSRLVATLRAARIAFADDPSNRDPRFTRARLRGLMPVLAGEGLDAARLALLARRLGQADSALELTVTAAEDLLVIKSGPGGVTYDRVKFGFLPDEIALRLLRRGISHYGTEGPVELAKLEALKAALDRARKTGTPRFRRSLAGAIVTLAGESILVERAPPRRGRTLTTRGRGKAGRPQTR
jgi:tRNA(Ile)-lysidine synthase